MAVKFKEMTPELVNGIYALLGISIPPGRAVAKIVIEMEAGKPVTLTEKYFPADVTVDAVDPPAPVEPPTPPAEPPSAA